MASLKIYEAFPSRSGTSGQSPSGSMMWIVMGTSDDILVDTFVASMTPGTHNGLLRQQIVKKEIALGTWECEVRYGAGKPPKANEYKFSFDTSGGKQKITQAIQHVATYPSSAGDHQGAIGVTDHSVDGCEIVVPSFSWQESWQLPIKSFGWAYSQTLKAITGRVNAGPFRNFPSGQVLFLGAKGQASSSDPKLIEIVYSFAQSDDVSGRTIGDISGIDKGGWHYLWVHYQEKDDDAAKTYVHRPDGVYVEQVYYPANFSALGIGS